MPHDRKLLVACLERMRLIYLANPNSAVRSSKFIDPLHDYCSTELIHALGAPKKIQILEKGALTAPRKRRKQIDHKKYQLIREATIAGSHKNKKVDLALTSYTNGPQIIIGVRSQMSSVHKNLLTYYEEIIGDCISLHDRFPMAVIGYVYLLPTATIKPGQKSKKVDLDRAEKLYSLITDRGDWRGPKDKYEHFAFLKVDFTSDPPTVLDTGAQLSIDSFFDKLCQTYSDRNFFNQI